MTRNQLERVERDGLPGEEIMRRAIDAVAADKPTMPELINRLWSEHQIRAEVSYYSHGGVRGIKYGIDVGEINSDGSPRLLWKQGNNLNKYKYSFNKLQAELGVSYDPQRDDMQIKSLTEMMRSTSIKPESQPDISTPLPKITSTPTTAELEPEVEPHRSLTDPQSAKLYAVYSRGLENLLPTDRDKEIAVRAIKQGHKAEEVEEIIATSPVDWTRKEAKLIVELAQSQHKRERELLQQQKERQQQFQQQLPERKPSRGFSR